MDEKNRVLKIEMRHHVPHGKKSCRYCNGTGIQTDKSGLRVPCPTCLGTGDENTPRIKW